MLIAWLAVGVCVLSITGSSPCVEDNDCGWHGKCNQGNCGCLAGYARRHNDKYCIDELCEQSRCLECWDSEKCSKCIDFVEETTGKCLDKCKGTYTFLVEGSQIGRVCAAEEKELWTTTYTAITVGCVAGLLLICVVVLCCCIRVKSSRDRKLRIDLHAKQMEKLRRQREQRLVSERVEKINGYSPSTANDGMARNRNETLQQLSRLEKHVDVLTHMYTQARQEIHRHAIDTPKCLELRNITHNLGRVLMLLRGKQSRVPHDVSVLLDWTERLLHDYLRTRQTRSAPSSRCVTPGDTLTRLTSTFRPDQELTVPNGHVTGDVSPSTTAMSFTYERGRGLRHDPDLAEISMIELQDQNNWTDSVVV